MLTFMIKKVFVLIILIFILPNFILAAETSPAQPIDFIEVKSNSNNTSNEQESENNYNNKDVIQENNTTSTNQISSSSVVNRIVNKTGEMQSVEKQEQNYENNYALWFISILNLVINILIGGVLLKIKK